MEIQTPLPPVIDEDSELVAWQLQEKEHFEQEQHDAEVAQRFSENEDSSSRQSRGKVHQLRNVLQDIERSSSSSTSENDIATSAYEAAGRSFTDSIIGNPDAALALEVQMIAIQTPLPPDIGEDSEWVECQLQEQEDFEQEQHDAEVAQRLSENDDSSSRQNRVRVDQLSNVLQDIERSIPSSTSENDIATSAYEAAGRSFTDSIIGNPDAALALEVQMIAIQTPLPPDIDEDSEWVECQLQEQEDFEQEQHDAEVAQRLFENDDSSSRQNRGRVDQLSNVLQDIERSSPSSISENDISTSAYEAAGRSFTDSIIRNPDAALALEVQMIAIQNPLPPVIDEDSERVECQLQEQDDFEQEQHDAEVAQKLFENDDSSSRQNRGRVDQLSNVLQDIERSSPISTSENDISTSAYEAAGRSFTDSIIGNPDAALALELQRIVIQTPLPPVIDEDSERVKWKLQEQKDFEQEQHDAEVAQRFSENEDSSGRQNRGRVNQLSNVLQDIERSSPSPTSKNDIATSTYESAGRSFTDSIIGNPDAALALELQRIEDSERVAWQLQEQEDFEQEQHDAEVAQRLFENDDSSSRQNRGRVDQLSNVLQDIERSSPSSTSENDIATSAYEAAGRSFTDSIIGNPDAALVLELQLIEIHTPLPPVIDEDSERVAWQLQKQEDFEQEQHDAEVAQRLFENEDSSSRQNRGRVGQLSNVLQDIERSSPSSTSENDIATSAYEAAGRSFTDSIIGNPNAALALELQRIEIQTPLPPVIDEDSERLAWQLQEQEDFEQEQHDAEVAQRLFENEDSSSRQNRGRVDQLSNVLQDIGRSSPSSTSGNSTPEQRGHGRLGEWGGFRMPRQHHRGDLQVDGDINLEDYESLWELQERNGDVHNNGLTPQQIGRIPHHKFKPRKGTTHSEKDCCRICLSEYANGENVKTLPCFHSYHNNCIDKWLKSQAVCPVCRENVKMH